MDATFFEALKRIPEREAELRAIPRYHIYKPMWYRTHLWTHTRRVAIITGYIGRLVAARIGRWLDIDHAQAVAHVHDDIERIIGDVQAGNKAKMTEQQKHALERREYAAIETLAHRSPRMLGPYNYQSLMLANMRRDTLETWIIQFADKLDGFGEAMHEIFAGNATGFATIVETEFGELPLPAEFYIEYFRGFAERYPKLGFLTQGPDRVLDVTQPFTSREAAQTGRLHNLFNVREPHPYQPYDLWRRILLEADPAEEMMLLTCPIET